MITKIKTIATICLLFSLFSLQAQIYTVTNANTYGVGSLGQILSDATFDNYEKNLICFKIRGITNPVINLKNNPAYYLLVENELTIDFTNIAERGGNVILTSNDNLDSTTTGLFRIQIKDNGRLILKNLNVANAYINNPSFLDVIINENYNNSKITFSNCSFEDNALDSGALIRVYNNSEKKVNINFMDLNIYNNSCYSCLLLKNCSAFFESSDIQIFNVKAVSNVEDTDTVFSDEGSDSELCCFSDVSSSDSSIPALGVNNNKVKSNVIKLFNSSIWLDNFNISGNSLNDSDSAVFSDDLSFIYLTNPDNICQNLFNNGHEANFSDSGKIYHFYREIKDKDI